MSACKVKQALEEAFNKADANGDGFVTGAELKKFMGTLDAYKSLSKADVEAASQELLKIADSNGDGKISKAEFLAANKALLDKLQ